MNLYPLSITLLLLFSSNTPTTPLTTPTLFTDDDDVSINCGSRSPAAASDGREWIADVQHIKGSSLIASSFVYKLIPTVDPIPHKTARLSRSQFSYTFRVSPGEKILRLHFHAAAYRGFETSKDLFSVEAGAFALLRSFSPSVAGDALGVRYSVKEFYLNIENHQHLLVVFSPELSSSLDTYAFVNGIEVLSVPAGLSYFEAVGKSLVYGDGLTALELVRRLDIRRDYVSDGGKMFGEREMVPKHDSNKVKNVTWITSVDVGFGYLIRFYFSEVGLKLVEIFGLSFKVYINEMIVIDSDIGIVREMDGENGTLLYRDYMVMMKGYKEEGRRDLLICLQSSNGEFILGHGPVTRVEILKMSNLDNSLASPNPLPLMQVEHVEELHRVVGCRNVVASLAVALLALVNIIVYTMRTVTEACVSEKEIFLSARAQRVCRHFSLAEIMSATRSFSDAHLVGKGGFGNVYRGLINGCPDKVAIKRLKSTSKQGKREFLTEIETLTELRHVNLVPLIGFCNENGEMILVYEYMVKGTLADHLYKLSSNGDVSSSLTWKQRLSICIGAGRGLDYLHTGHSLIHRDVKASNILLDEGFVAKVSDFGLAKHLSGSRLHSHVSTKIKGTYWYMDPSYVTTGKLSRKSDIYAFGVLLLEVLSGRRAVDSSVADEERVLTAWARENISEGHAERIVASNLKGEISEESLKAFVGIAIRCLHGEPKKRPTMAQAVLELEFALEQQESSRSIAPYAITSGLNELRNSKMAPFEPSSGRKDVRRAMAQKPSYLWQRGLLIKRGYNATKTVQKDDNIVVPAIPADESKVKRGGHRQMVTIPWIPADELEEITAVKKLDSKKQPLQEFLAKASMISSLRHEHVVELLGCCVDGELRVLVYEYAPNGSLHDILHGKKGIEGSRPDPPLSWKKRVGIAVGTAKGLAYIHEKQQIHGGIRSSNDLLFGDSEVAKITDFDIHSLNKKTNFLHGLKWFISGGKHVPAGQKSWMSDVYSFGVAKAKLSKDQMTICVDARMKGDYPPMAVAKMAEVAASCMRDEGASRPQMSFVVEALQPLMDAASLP